MGVSAVVVAGRLGTEWGEVDSNGGVGRRGGNGAIRN